MLNSVVFKLSRLSQRYVCVLTSFFMNFVHLNWSKQIILSLLLFFGANAIRAQVGAPNLACVSTDIGGNINLSWAPPADPLNQFVSYDIWTYNIFSGTSNLIGTVGNIASTSYTHNGGLGNFQSVCYYVTTNYNDGVLQTSVPSDTVCNLYMQANPSITPGFVTLEWNEAYYGGGTNPNSYLISVENPIGVWTQVANIPYDPGYNLFEYEVTECNADLNFQIQLQGSTGCFFSSNIDGGNYSDEADALPPIINTVSVDSLLGNAFLEWEPSVSADVAGYIIYECINNFTFAIDTIFDPNATSYMNNASSANTSSEGYTIAAFDDCFVMGEPDPGPAANACSETIYLQTSWSACQSDVTLFWSAYNTWTNGVQEYRIYAQETTSLGVALPSFLLATVDGNSTSYIHTGATLSSTYRYRVKAVENITGNTSESNTRVQLLFYPEAPVGTRIATATVQAPNDMLIAVEIDENNVFTNTYILERRQLGQSITGPFEFEEIAVQSAGAGANAISFNDLDVSTSDTQYDYRVIVENGCNDKIDTTEIARPMLLTGVANTERLVNTLFWTPYVDWELGVSDYEIYRSNEVGELGELLVSLPGGVLSFEDDVSDLLYTPGEFCYTIKANETPGFNIAFNSLSNQRCITQEPKIWVPNAFVVGGVNNTFQPVISFADFERYEMYIFNRWGDLVYETDLIEEGWNGSANGAENSETLMEGVYTYFIKVQDGAGRVYERRGTLTLLYGQE